MMASLEESFIFKQYIQKGGEGVRGLQNPWIILKEFVMLDYTLRALQVIRKCFALKKKLDFQFLQKNNCQFLGFLWIFFNFLWNIFFQS